MTRPVPPLVLTFAATDPSSGAGLQADILTLASIGCYPLSVVTGITVQDTLGVDSVMALDADWVNEQARTVLEDMEVAAFKLGMLGSVENVAIIAEIVADYPDIPLLIDPILTSGRGDELAGDEIQDAMIDLLFPQASLLTPNSLEARRLAFGDDADEEDGESLDECARQLLALGSEYVLITGTHERTNDVEYAVFRKRPCPQLYLGAPARQLPWLRLHPHFRHCRLSRAWPDDGRSRGRGAGIYLANATGGVPPRHGSIYTGSFVLGAGRRGCSRLRGFTR